MSEVYKQIPAWFWLLIFSGGAVVLGSLLTILVWFLKKFLEDNKDSWKEINNAVNNLVQVTTKHDTQIFEIQKDVIELRADFRGLPTVKHTR